MREKLPNAAHNEGLPSFLSPFLPSFVTFFLLSLSYFSLLPSFHSSPLSSSLPPSFPSSPLSFCIHLSISSFFPSIVSSSSYLPSHLPVVLRSDIYSVQLDSTVICSNLTPVVPSHFNPFVKLYEVASDCFKQ